MDVEMPGPTGYGEELKKRFETGKADIALLDRAVLRVLTAKFRMGLFEHPFAMADDALGTLFNTPEEKKLSLQSARESLVMLKNDGTLPLKKSVRKIALIGPHGDSPRKFFGGYTLMCMAESTLAVANSIAGVSGTMTAPPESIRTIQGTHVQSDEGPEFDAILKRQKPDCASLLMQMRRDLPDTEIAYAPGYPVAGEDESGFAEALRITEDADVVVLTLGGKHGTCSMSTMGEGVDAANINLPACQERFIRKAVKLGKPLIGVHLDGRPISSDAADECLSAILECWSPAEFGARAITEALTGAYNPGGKLPVTVAYHAGQIPLYYNHPNGSAWHQGGSIGFADYVDLPHRPRYCFGFGLSYTTFAYSDFRLSASEIGPDDTLKASVTVQNTGMRAGDEVIQLYASDTFASRTRPVQELIGFRRIHLEPGGQKKVSFTLHPSQLAFLDANMRWKIEKGRLLLRVGSSSRDIRAEESFTITRDAWIDGKNRGMVCAAAEK